VLVLVLVLGLGLVLVLGLDLCETKTFRFVGAYIHYRKRIKANKGE
jgi:hypothetical protein